jgi:predicted dehydrogenase
MLKKSATGAAAAAGASAFGAPALLAERAPTSKLGMAVIGSGGRGSAHIPVAASEHLVALVDVDDNRMAGALKGLAKNPAVDVSKIKTYYDYRKMFDEVHKQLDAVFVAVPDNQHACASMMAIKLGKHVYCEKPLTHDIYEARALGEAARKYNVMTQMGNQGHAGEGIRALREYLEAGAIGTVLETHSWQDQYYGGRTRMADRPVPAGLHWDEWIGPGAYTEYRDGLHPAPGWYQWQDYGTGLLACVGAHTFDAVHWGLQLKYPSSVEAVEQEGATPGVWPTLNTLLYEFPRPGLPTLRAYWYDGRHSNPNAKDKDGRPYPKGPNYPRLADELTAKYGRNLTGGGTIFVGEKGYMFCDVYVGGTRIVPEEKHKEFPAPPKKYPRTRGIHADFLRAVKEGGVPPSSNFPDASGPYIESLLVGNLAMWAGVGRKVQWDGVAMKCTNIPELNQYVKREYRKGWSL